MNQLAYAALIVLRHKNGTPELLMARRAEEKYMGGTWQLISGRIETGEAAWQAALRELREETSLAAVELYRLTSVDTFYRSDVDSLAFAVPFCALVSNEATVRLNAENTAFAWFGLPEAATKLMWPCDRRWLDEVIGEILCDGMSKPYLRIALPPSEPAGQCK
jgi:dATP pyrophosphohydrolase